MILQRINYKNVVTVSTSLVNLILSLFFVFIWIEYLDAIFLNQLNRLELNNIPTDIVIMLLSLFFLILSLIVLIRYFKNKKTSPFIPETILCIYITFFIITALIN